MVQYGESSPDSPAQSWEVLPAVCLMSMGGCVGLGWPPL